MRPIDALRRSLPDPRHALGFVVLLFAVWVVASPASPPTGEPAPDLVAETLDGDTFRLAEHDLVVVNFWATWCPPCRAEIPELAAFGEAHPDIPVVGVSVDQGLSADALARWVGRSAISYPVVHDASGTIAGAWGVHAMPTTVVVADGEIRAAHVGAVDRHALEALVGAR